LIETDFVAQPIRFQDKTFDIVVAMGVFEYMGEHEEEKLVEIESLLKPGGRFLMSYINFDHFRRIIYPAYNNVQSIDALKAKVSRVFHIDRCYPVSHHRRHKQPGKNALPAVQMQFNLNIPFLSSWLAVEYFCLCSRKES
jgi:cyclopropane fatty-acyl-phospholipid synthase-like methyltransferase